MSAFAAELLLAASGISFLAVLVIYCVGAFGPGPNNLILLVSGSRVGFWRSVPQILGITAGVAGLCIFQGFVLGAFFQQLPAAYIVLRVIFSLALVWLAWKIASIQPESGEEGEEEHDPAFPIPFGFRRGFLFQAVNPKAWAVVSVLVTNYGSGDPALLPAESIVIAAGTLPFTLAATSVWALFGVSLRAWLREPLRAKIFYRLMAALLLACLIPAYL